MDSAGFFRCGPLIDLCRGPHVRHTGKVKAFAVTKVRNILLFVLSIVIFFLFFPFFFFFWVCLWYRHKFFIVYEWHKNLPSDCKSKKQKQQYLIHTCNEIIQSNKKFPFLWASGIHMPPKQSALPITHTTYACMMQIIHAKVEKNVLLIWPNKNLLNRSNTLTAHLGHWRPVKGHILAKLVQYSYVLNGPNFFQNSSTYWEGKADAETLQRIYGISFPDPKQLKEWKHFQEEAAKRDHRKIGRVSPSSCFGFVLFYY